MAGTIGGVACHLVKCQFPQIKERSERWFVPGIDGYGIALLGAGDSEFALRGVLYGTSSAVELWAIAIQSLQGSIVTVVNDWGVSHTRVFVEEVGECKKVACYVPGTTTQARGEIAIKGAIV